MKAEVAWITDALSSKNLAREMTHYRVERGEIRATDGRLTAGHPFPHDGPFLVPGAEFEKILKRLEGDPRIDLGEGNIVLKYGRSRGTIKTLPIEKWDYPGIDEDAWDEVPEGLVAALRDLRPFVSDNATQPWALGVALYHGYAYATNNVVLAGVRCDALGEINAIMPVWAVEFLIDREEGLAQWQWTDHYVAFQWESGAWMRAQLIDAQFPEQATRLVTSAEQATPSEPITKEFKKVYDRASALCDGLIIITPEAIRGNFGEASFEDGVSLPTLATSDGGLSTLWASKYLTPVLAVATSWEPVSWPKPAFFKGDRIFGVIMGRKS